MNDLPKSISVIIIAESMKLITTKVYQKSKHLHNFLKSGNYLRSLVMLLFLIIGIGVLIPIQVQAQMTKESPSYFEPCTIPFDMVGNKIAIAAVVNDVEGYLFFENGTSGLVLNEEHIAPGKKSGYSNIFGKSIKVSKKISMVDINCTGHIFNASLVGDLSHAIKADDGKVILGFIGASIFENGAITIDMQNSILLFTRSPRVGVPAGFTSSDQALEMTIDNDIPVVTAKWGDHEIKVGLLSSSSTCLIDERFVKKNVEVQLPVYWGPAINFVIAGLSVQETPIHKYDLRSFNQRFDQVSLKGILGRSFFNRHLVAFDYKNSKVWINKYGKHTDFASSKN